MLRLLKAIGLPLFRLLFAVEYHGLSHIPDKGAVMIAGNHPSYLDPALVALPARRVIRFMAWDALFRVPVLGQIIRALGAFPVDIRRGQGDSAFREAVRILRNGDALGIFPEGKRSDHGRMDELRTGVARLAIETGAAIVPVTIGGASRAWPKHRLAPRPARIVVRFHAPIRLDAATCAARGQEKEFHLEVMQMVAEQINQSLGPALRGDAALERWYRQPPSHLRTYEWAPLVAAIIAALLTAGRGAMATQALVIWAPAIFYYLYLITDLTLIPPGRLAKWLRNSMPVWLILVWHQGLAGALQIPVGARNPMLAAGTLGAFFLFFYEDYYALQKFVRGLVVVYYFSLLFLLRWPEPRGTLTAVFLFIALFAWWYRMIFRWWVVTAMALLLAVALSLTGPPTAALTAFVTLPALTLAYLQSFVNAAYDIRRAGQVSEEAGRAF
ncbi:MAG: lysophospholipid acyltransferase family protein [Blastocatellia bacterium]